MGGTRGSGVRTWPAIAWALCQSLGCLADLPRPAYAQHPSSALVEVPVPPPPARVEFIPKQPKDSAVWIDGEWAWRGKRWAWTYGGWVLPLRGASYAPWVTARSADGRLFYAKGAWRDAAGRELLPPPMLALARAAEGDIVDREGDVETTAPNVAPPAVPDGGVSP